MVTCCSHHETCGVCHTSGLCEHTGQLELFIMRYVFPDQTRAVAGFDLDATIAWRQAAARDEALTLPQRAEHEQMADWLVELKNLRTLL